MPEAVMLTDSKVASIKPPATGQDEHPDLKVTGLRLRVGITGKKSWIVRKRHGDRMICSTLGEYPRLSVANARKAAEEKFDQLNKRGVEGAKRTFGDATKAWVEKKKADAKRNRSIDQQQRRLELHVLPKWKDKRIAEIERADVRDLIKGVNGGAALKNAVLANVSAVFRHALAEEDWIDVNPAAGLPRQNENPRDRVLGMDEIRRVWHAADQLPYPFGPYIKTMLLTAQRRTEVASMKWADINVGNGTWIMQAADTKAARRHLVALSGPMIELLEALPRLGAYVFSTDGETHISGYAKLKAQLDEIVGPIERWRLHDIRRSVSTELARLGFSDELRGRVMNHSKEGVTDRHYTVYDFAKQKQEVLDAWGNELLEVEVDNVIRGAFRA